MHAQQNKEWMDNIAISSPPPSTRPSIAATDDLFAPMYLHSELHKNLKLIQLIPRGKNTMIRNREKIHTQTC